MQFGKNKSEYIHRWYPFVEGYSREFILKILNEYKSYNNTQDIVCLEPFTGSGTTPLELQKLGYKCYSFEVSPFMYDVACCKMEETYTIRTFDNYYYKLHNLLSSMREYSNEEYLSNFKTLVEREGQEKWIFNKEVRLGILDILNSINEFRSKKYKRLYKVALASILLDVSNVYRNGKCVSYKKNWKVQVQYKRTDIHNLYLKKLNEIYRADIFLMEKEKALRKMKSNIHNCFCGDCRDLIFTQIDNNSIDLVITSPPYLNSRDYTDTYMVELKTLGYMNDLKDVNKLRKKTLRSHVQVKWGELDTLQITELTRALTAIEKHKEEFWNDELLNMIKGYFIDMNTLFSGLKNKMKSNGMIFFNVANSAYCNIEIKVDEIVCKIAELNGFKIKEIREARRVKPSSQQQLQGIINGLRESVIVMYK